MSPRLALDLLPEAILLLGVLALLALAALRRRPGFGVCGIVALLCLGAAAVVSLARLRGLAASGEVASAGGLIVDRYSIFAAVLLCSLAAVAVAASQALQPRIADRAAEYFALLLCAVIGALLFDATGEMIALYVALEVLSVSLIVLVGIVKIERRSGEAALRQLLVGAAGSAALLYSLAILYGLSGSTVLGEVSSAIRGTPAVGALAIALLVCGLGIKLGLVPGAGFVPDVIEGAPAPVAGAVVSLGTTAGFIALARVLVTTFSFSTSTWTALIAGIAVVSLLLGSLAALGQGSMRRLIAWLAVAQGGYVLIGLLGWRQQGVASSLVALVVEGLSIAGLLAAVGVAEGSGTPDRVEAYAGLSRRNPLAATMLALGMLSLAGAPPLAGFFARFFVLEAAVSAGFAWLLLLALVATLIGAASCLRVVRLVLADAPVHGEHPGAARSSTAQRLALGVCALSTVALSVLAEPVLALATGAGGQLR